MGAPRTDRPHGGYWDTTHKPRLRWSWAAERLDRAHNYWVTTARADGHPYSRPVWGLWFDGAVVFESWSLDENLKRAQNVEVHLESGDEVVIIKGTAERLDDPAKARRFVTRYNEKYSWNWDPKNPPELIWAIRPQIAFGWVSRLDDRGAAFGETGTRWTFDG